MVASDYIHPEACSGCRHKEAEAECKTANTSAYGYGYGKAAANGTLKVNFRNEGKVEGAGKFISNQKLDIEGDAKSAARARAFAYCEESEGPGPNPSNLPPVVTIDNLQHLYENETGVVCGTARDPENDPISASFSVTNGNIVSGEFPGNDPQEECVTVKAPANSEDDPTMTVTYTAVSPNGQGGNYSVSKSSVINVENDDF